ncbi:unnamed protein product [Soboliphyme baturini]|uniref:TFIIS N-terminal domain-containing protein n=1 Tax=Soboliphyme baturini TaxID=241478 RepID=A0A183J6I1_9BILA|nr:unnamed protein product [Soboliphyme baturini]
MCASQMDLQRTVEVLKQQLLRGETDKVWLNNSDDAFNLDFQKRITLKKLEDLKISVHILLETKIGKLVNSFRHDDLLGPLAKRVVAKWKEDAYESARASGIVIEAAASAKLASSDVDTYVERELPSSECKETCDIAPATKRDKPKVDGKNLCLNDSQRNRRNNNVELKSNDRKPKLAKKSVSRAAAESAKFTSDCSSFENALLSADDVVVQRGQKKTVKPLKRSVDRVKQVEGKCDLSKDAAKTTHYPGFSALDVDLSKVLSKTVPDYHPVRHNVVELPTNSRKRAAGTVHYAYHISCAVSKWSLMSTLTLPFCTQPSTHVETRLHCDIFVTKIRA